MKTASNGIVREPIPLCPCTHLKLLDETPEPVTRLVRCNRCGCICELRPDGTIWWLVHPPYRYEERANPAVRAIIAAAEVLGGPG